MGVCVGFISAVCSSRGVDKFVKERWCRVTVDKRQRDAKGCPFLSGQGSSNAPSPTLVHVSHGVRSLPPSTTQKFCVLENRHASYRRHPFFPC